MVSLGILRGLCPHLPLVHKGDCHGVTGSLKYPSLQPAVALLVHRIPRWQVIWHQPPCGARSDKPAQTMKDLSEAMVTLRGVLRHEDQIGGDKGPFIVTHISRIGLAFHVAKIASLRSKCITPSRVIPCIPVLIGAE